MMRKSFRLSLFVGVAGALIAGQGQAQERLSPPPPVPGQALQPGQAPGSEAPTLAQPQPSAAPSTNANGLNDTGGTNLDEIVVTARKIRETQLETPVAITAFTSAAIQDRDITSLNDVAQYTPSLNFENNVGGRTDRLGQTIDIRGTTPSAASPTVSVFVDGAPIAAGFLDGIDDAERIEVLKGPQSAAFGRSVFAGAINVVTKLPSEDFHATIEGLAGSDDYTDDRLTLEGPIIPNILTARVTARYYSRNGQYTNEANTNERLGDQSTRSVAGTLYATPIKGLRAKLFVAYDEDHDGPSGEAKFTNVDYNCNAGGAATYNGLNYICGTLPGYNLNRLAQNDTVDALFNSTIIHNSTGKINPIFSDNLGLDHGGLVTLTGHAALTIDYDLPYNFTLTSLGAVNNRRYAAIHDLDNQNTVNDPNPYYGINQNTEPFVNYLFDSQGIQRDYSEELRLAGQIWRVRTLIGLSYEHQYTETENAALGASGPTSYVNGNPQEVLTRAVFFSLSYDIIKQLTLSFDGRYQTDHITPFTRAADDGPITKAVGAMGQSLGGAFNNFVPRVILQYRPASYYQIYASYSQGVNPGNFNTNFITYSPAQQAAIQAQVPGVGFEVQPEKLTDYELGIKGEFFDRTFQVSADVYYEDWTNQIINQFFLVPLPNSTAVSTASLSTNSGETLMRGVEVEGLWRPIKGLTINFSGAVNGSDTLHYQTAIGQTLEGNVNAVGKQLPYYSKYNAALGAEYTAPFVGDIDYFSRVDYTFKSGQYDSVLNLAKTQDDNQVNVRLGLTRPKQRLEFFVTNLFDCKAYLGIENNTDLASPGFVKAGTGSTYSVVNAELPILREVGVRFRQSF